MKNNKPKKQDKTEEILEIVSFIKDNAVTRGEFNDLADEVRKMKTEMVTKDYLDDKMADLRGDLVVLTRKEDTKIKELIKILESKKVLSKSEVKKILSMEPFPQLAL
ncbi:MAG TPA: hypothetical protein P5267_02755 [Patescibacteria group bacterium]|nr:hypothetical protein [Patescibacteria group bacterium]